MARINALEAGTVFASAARTATPTAVEFTNYGARGVRFAIDVTAITATPSVTFNIFVKDELSGNYPATAILTSAAITATGQTVLRIYPGITAAANVAVSDIIGKTIKVTATHGDADSITYSMGYLLIP